MRRGIVHSHHFFKKTFLLAILWHGITASLFCAPNKMMKNYTHPLSTSSTLDLQKNPFNALGITPDTYKNWSQKDRFDKLFAAYKTRLNTSNEKEEAWRAYLLLQSCTSDYATKKKVAAELPYAEVRSPLEVLEIDLSDYLKKDSPERNALIEKKYKSFFNHQNTEEEKLVLWKADLARSRLIGEFSPFQLLEIAPEVYRNSGDQKKLSAKHLRFWSLKLHPDKGGDEDLCKLLNAAYGILIDEDIEAKKGYCEFLSCKESGDLSYGEQEARRALSRIEKGVLDSHFEEQGDLIEIFLNEIHKKVTEEYKGKVHGDISSVAKEFRKTIYYKTTLAEIDKIQKKIDQLENLQKGKKSDRRATEIAHLKKEIATFVTESFKNYCLGVGDPTRFTRQVNRSGENTYEAGEKHLDKLTALSRSRDNRKFTATLGVLGGAIALPLALLQYIKRWETKQLKAIEDQMAIDSTRFKGTRVRAVRADAYEQKKSISEKASNMRQLLLLIPAIILPTCWFLSQTASQPAA